MVERVAELPLAYEPGTVLHYSIGFDVMALIIERVTGKTYDAFLRQRLFDPLDMRSTGFHVAPQDAPRLSTNYQVTLKDEKVTLNVTDAGGTSAWLEKPTLLAGGGGLISSARDFSRYSGMLLGEGSYDGTRVMKVETARLALSNLRPPGIADPSEGVGAGTRAMLLNRPIPAGTFGGGGASGVFWWIDPVRRGNVTFMTQTIGGYTPTTLPYPRQINAAIEEDLLTRTPTTK